MAVAMGMDVGVNVWGMVHICLDKMHGLEVV